MAAPSSNDALTHIAEARRIINMSGSSFSFEELSALKDEGLCLQEDITRTREEKWVGTIGEFQTRVTQSTISRFSSLYSKLQALVEERETLVNSHEQEKQDLISAHKSDIEKLQKQINEENFCVICHENPRDTLVMPCSHFQFCFPCMVEHQKVNGKTCPTCRGPINGICMSDPRKMRRAGGSTDTSGMMMPGYSPSNATNVRNRQCQDI